ncbi:MAG: parS [Bacteroidetes bacterium]|nr:parS [Bacteroidota bacterium]
MQKRLIRFAGISGAIGVALGAMAAHFLKTKMESGAITANELQAFETGARYQIYHSLALLCLALLSDKLNSRLIPKAGYCFMAGIVLFSGSLYLLSTAGLMGLGTMRWLGPVTPLGGVFLIAGWLLTGFSAFKKE